MKRHLVRASYYSGDFCHWDLHYRWPTNEKECASLEALFKMLVDVARMSLPEQGHVATSTAPDRGGA